MEKVLYVDLETTGVDKSKNGVIQIAGIIEVTGRIKEKFDFLVKPFDNDEIEDKALEINKRTREEIATFEHPVNVSKKLIVKFDRYIDKFNKEDKFIFAGYNANFDMGFLRTWFKNCSEGYFGSYVLPKPLDPYPFMVYLKYLGITNTENEKLETVCKYFDIPLDAHNAMSDIEATRALIKRINVFLKSKKVEDLHDEIK